MTVVEQSKCARKTKNNIVQLYQAFGLEKIFGRSDVLNVLSITVSPASPLLKKIVVVKHFCNTCVLIIADSCPGFERSLVTII